MTVALVIMVGIGTPPPESAWAADSGAPAAQERLLVTGTIEQLDLSEHKGLLKTATGKPVFFDIVKPELFKGMRIGQEVTLQLDEHGRAIKAIETQSIPELPAPAH
jgi:hypothetical protein